MNQIAALAKSFRAAADAATPTNLQQFPQGLAGALSFYDPERARMENIVWSVMCAIARAFEEAAKEETGE